MMEGLRPARPVAPGRILKRELEARGWTQRDLAAILGRPEQLISEIVNGTKQITPETSVDLGEAFGTSPEFWHNLEANYRLQLAQLSSRSDAISRRGRLYERLPLQEMARRNWIKLHADPEALEAEVCVFFGVTAFPQAVSVNARLRCSTARRPATFAQLAWLRRAEQLAEQQEAAAWRPESVPSLVEELLSLTAEAEGVANVRSVLARWGVRSVFLRHIAKTFLDGAAFFVDEAPCVGLTLRYDRIDAFWFTLLHEVAHIASGGREPYLDSLADTGDEDCEMETPVGETDAGEEEADSLASQWLIDPTAFKLFIAKTAPYFSRAKIGAFAASQCRHPGIVLGCLQREGQIPYKNLRPLLVKVSPYLKDQVAD